MSSSPVQEIHDDLLKQKQIRFFVKRDDLLDPVISGNKFRKLKYNLEEAKLQGKEKLLTFGGAYSNHIHALAYAGKKFGFATIGIIRGEGVSPLNPTLTDAEAFGMHLEFISREAYKEKYSDDFVQRLRERYGDFYLVPEGGANVLAIKGCEEIVDELEEEYDFICCSSGTGATFAGIVTGLDGKGKAIGFPALKGGGFLRHDIELLIRERKGKSYTNWLLNTDFHFGGYAKFKPELIDFINGFKGQHDIPLDPIYTGKMVYGIFDLIRKDFFHPGSRILAVHTGGIQGIRGFNERYGGMIL